MTKYILHGGYTNTDNELNKGFFNEISKELSEGDNILVVYFSRQENEYEKLFNQDKQNILNNANGKKLEITLAFRSDFINQIKKSNAIYMRGGDTEQLLATLKAYPDFIEAIKNKVVAGSSAGAYVLAKYYYTHSKDMVREGLNILPIRLICHYNNSKELIDRFNQYSKEFELIILKDYEYKVIKR